MVAGRFGESPTGVDLSGEKPPGLFRKRLAHGGQIGLACRSGRRRSIPLIKADGQYPIVLTRLQLNRGQIAGQVCLQKSADVRTAVVDGRDDGWAGNKFTQGHCPAVFISEVQVEGDKRAKLLINTDLIIRHRLC